MESFVEIICLIVLLMSLSMLGNACIACGKTVRARSRRREDPAQLSSDEEDDLQYLRERGRDEATLQRN